MRKRDVPAAAAFSAPTDSAGIRNLLMLVLLVGVLSGGIFGTYSTQKFLLDLPVFSIPAKMPETFSSSLWNAGKYFLFILIAATTYLGILLAPALVLLRGYTLGCTAAAMFAEHSYAGLLHAFLLCGVSAVFTLPVIMLLADDSFCRARELILLRRGRHLFPEDRAPIRRHALLAVFLILLDALYGCFILPHLIS